MEASAEEPVRASEPSQPGLGVIAREWGRIGCVGFGGPPAHIALLRRLCVEERGWIPSREFEDGIAATNLLPGPASTQLAIFCAWRLQGGIGAVVGGLSFILPGLVFILGLSSIFIAASPPVWVEGAAAGAGAAVPIVALHAAYGLMPSSWRRTAGSRARRLRWVGYVLAGAVAAATVGPMLVIVLVACGVLEAMVTSRSRSTRTSAFLPLLVAPAMAMGGLGALAWVALKVGALSYGGGFVIIPLMQRDAVQTYHWMTGTQFLSAVALGQITPGPVVQTVAVVGFAAAGIWGGLLAALIAFAPSFGFVLVGGPRFDAFRRSEAVTAFLSGAGPAAIGAIAGASIPLGLALDHAWQAAILVLAAGWLLALRRGVVSGLIGSGALGVIAALAGAPIGR
jgi:chromate transporter